MERREFLRFALGIAAGAGAMTAAASAVSAAPMLATPLDMKPEEPDTVAQPAVADQDDLADARAEQVQYHRRHHRRHRRPPPRRRHWHRRRYYF